MDSNSISKYGFSQWGPFTLGNKKTLLQLTPAEPGVYVVRHSNGSFGRLRGSSDILYIGKSEARGGMRQRIRGYFNPGPSQWTNQRIHSFLQRQVAMELRVMPTRNPRQLESQLIEQYVADHDELPPFNRSE